MMSQFWMQAVRYNNILMVLDIGLIILFVYSWIGYYKKYNQNVSYWYFQLFVYYFVQLLIMYPFAGSEFNALFIGPQNVPIVQNNISNAFILFLFGYFFAFLGGKLFDINKHNFVIINMFILPFDKTLGLFYSKIVQSKYTYLLLCAVYLTAQIIFVLFMTYQGILGNPRAYFQINTNLRPIYNSMVSSFMLIIFIIGIRMLQFNRLVDKVLFALSTITGFFIGVRYPLFYQLLIIAILYAYFKKSGKVSFVKLALGILVLVCCIIMANMLRIGKAPNLLETEGFYFFYQLFYGSTFSDLRDFTWLFGTWDKPLLYGKGYLAALMSFIPSFVSEFRQEWAFGRISIVELGFDPTVHPGIRTGLFGEMYFNFGMVGVVAYGFLWGYVMKYVDFHLREFRKSNNVIAAGRLIISTYFVYVLAYTPMLIQFYVYVFILTIFFIVYLLEKDCLNKVILNSVQHISK